MNDVLLNRLVCCSSYTAMINGMDNNECTSLLNLFNYLFLLYFVLYIFAYLFKIGHDLLKEDMFSYKICCNLMLSVSAND